jgi:hypothetical protein
MAYTEEGVETFGKLQAHAEPVVTAIADHMVRHACNVWVNTHDEGRGRLERQINDIFDRVEQGEAAKDAELSAMGVLANVEEYAFIVGFETARRLMGGAR